MKLNNLLTAFLFMPVLLHAQDGAQKTHSFYKFKEKCKENPNHSTIVTKNKLENLITAQTITIKSTPFNVFKAIPRSESINNNVFDGNKGLLESRQYRVSLADKNNKDLHLGQIIEGRSIFENPKSIEKWNKISDYTLYGQYKSNGITIQNAGLNKAWFESNWPQDFVRKSGSSANYSCMEISSSSSGNENGFGVSASIPVKGVTITPSLEMNNDSGEQNYSIKYYVELYDLVLTKIDSLKFDHNSVDHQKLYSDLSPNKIPIYVSKLTYGFIIEAKFTSKSSMNEIKAGLGVEVAGAGCNVKKQNKNVFANTSFQIVAIGSNNTGVSSVSGLEALESSIQRMIAANHNNDGILLSCEFKYLYDDSSTPVNIQKAMNFNTYDFVNEWTNNHIEISNYYQGGVNSHINGDWDYTTLTIQGKEWINWNEYSSLNSVKVAQVGDKVYNTNLLNQLKKYITNNYKHVDDINGSNGRDFIWIYSYGWDVFTYEHRQYNKKNPTLERDRITPTALDQYIDNLITNSKVNNPLDRKLILNLYHFTGLGSIELKMRGKCKNSMFKCGAAASESFSNGQYKFPLTEFNSKGELEMWTTDKLQSIKLKKITHY